jgi:cytochrome c peroxidase
VREHWRLSMKSSHFNHFCHTNAGALSINGGTATSTRMSRDGGFGRTDNHDGTFGNRTFNTASVVEAADTAPFFHNNVVSTLEETVGF